MIRPLSLCVALALACVASVASRAQSPDPAVFINEIHYDNIGTDTGEFIEIAGPAGTNLAGYTIELYNGTGGARYDVDALSGIIPDQQNGFGTITLSYPSNGIQNGSPDGIALVNASGTVIQFLSYEGAFTAVGGPANTLMSTDIGVAENGAEPVGWSLQLKGTGDTYSDFTWAAPGVGSPGLVNTGQSFGTTPPPPPTPSLSINDVTVTEGNSGLQSASFTVSLTSAAGASGVSFKIDTADQSATVGVDYQQVSETVTIAAGGTNHTFVVPVIGDTSIEPDETFTVTISQVTNANVADDTATGTITNDDAVTPPSTAIVINEVDADQAGTDTQEFVELYDGGVGNTPLNGFVLVFYNGNGNVSYRAVDLDGKTTDASGYFLLGNAAVVGADMTLPANGLQNGADAVALYVGDASTFPTGTSLTTVNLVDAIVYGPGTDGAGLLPLLNAGQAQVNESTTTSNQRCPNGEGGTRNTASFKQLAPTPDAANGPCPVPPPPAVARTISEIQGTANASEYVGTDVITTGVVTGRKSNGFFLQMPSPDTDPQTSDAVFVFTGTPAEVSAAGVMRLVRVGDALEVTGRVVEFRRTGDSRPETFTELSAPLSIALLSENNPLPNAVDAAVIYSSNALSRSAQLERYESMLVAAGDLRVVAPTNGFGEFYAVLAGTNRPFREPGILSGDPLPSDAPVPNSIPTFDGNFERIMVESDEQFSEQPGTNAVVRRTPLHVATNAVVSGVWGPLDYAFDEYRIQVDASATLTSSGGFAQAVPVPDAASNEFTVGSTNLLQFINPSPDRIAKAALMIRRVVRAPAILGLIEVGNLTDIQQLADKINQDAGTSYEAYLLDANPTSSNEQNIGFLVDSARVEVVGAPTQLYKGKTFEFAGVTDTLHDRPPLVMKVNVLRAGTSQKFPVTVMLLHLKSLIEVDSTEPRAGGLTLGQRNREKRRLGAEDVADAIEELQNDNLIVLGDLNAFEFSDGYVDVVGTLAGTPAPTDQVVEASEDRWDHQLFNLIDDVDDQEQRYSYVFGGSAQVLDHVLVNSAMLAQLSRFQYARNNADFPASLTNDLSRPEAFSDHDVPVAYFAFPRRAELSVLTSVGAGGETGAAFTYSITVANAGPDAAQEVTLSVPSAVNLGAASMVIPDGWTCNASTGGAVSCNTSTLAAGGSAEFLISATVSCAVQDGTVIAQTATVATLTPEFTFDNNNASYTITASNAAPVINGVITPIVVSPIPGAPSAGAVVNDALLGMPTVTDNCAGTTLTRTGVPAGNLFPVGVSTITYTAVDSAGAVTTATASVHVLNAVQSLQAIEAELAATTADDAIARVRRALSELTATPADAHKAATQIAAAIQELEKAAARGLVDGDVAEGLLGRLTGVNWLMAMQADSTGRAVQLGDRFATAGNYHSAAVLYGTVVPR